LASELSMEKPSQTTVSTSVTYKGPSVAGFILTLMIAAGLYFGMTYLPKMNLDFLSYSVVAENAPHSLFYKMVWFVQDFTNAQFYASFFAGIGMLLGAVIAYYLSMKRSSKSGFTISYTVGIWPWVFAAQLLGLIISVFVCNYVNLLEITGMGWVPTFIPFVSIPVIVVLIYGPSWRSVLTGAIFGGLTGPAIGTGLIYYIMNPLNLPAVAANTFTMSLTGIIVLEMCRHLPWMKKTELQSQPEPENDDKKPAVNDTSTASWFVRRVFADFTEAQFWGNEWASGLMIVGLLADWFINPQSVYYGNGTVPLMLSCAILSSAIGVFLYHKQWTELGFYATFVPVVSIVPGIVALTGGNPVFGVLAAVIGGIIGPPFADAINRHIPEGWHPMIGNTFSMSVCTLIIAFIVKALPIGIGF
jgi:hypothetical protein